MVRLGQGVFTDGKLNNEAYRRTLNAFHSFNRTAKELRVDKMIAFGTAALREASDGAGLLESIKDETGIEVRVISGAEEAKLISMGVLGNEKLPKGRFGLVDIGGGSTEISICRGTESEFATSFSLGTAKLQQLFLKSSPPKPMKSGDDPVKALRKYIRGAILTKTLTDEWPKKIDKFIGSSGTVRALARLCNKGKPKPIDRGDLKKLVENISTMTTTELLGLPAMEAKRVDMILAGAILLEEVMNLFKAKKVFPTEYSLRDGILEEQLAVIRANEHSSLGIHLKEMRERVAEIHPNMVHTDAVIRLTSKLFDSLGSVHKLKSGWKSYLTAAATIHDVGEIISPTGHEEHSYYFAKHADLAPMEEWESEFIALLCLYHRAGKANLPDFGKNSKEKKVAFLKLLALLRVADALDRGHRGDIQISRISITKKSVEIRLRSKPSPDLELLRIEQKKELFETIFDRKLVVRA